MSTFDLKDTGFATIKLPPKGNEPPRQVRIDLFRTHNLLVGVAPSIPDDGTKTKGQRQVAIDDACREILIGLGLPDELSHQQVQDIADWIALECEQRRGKAAPAQPPTPSEGSTSGTGSTTPG